MCSKKYFFKEKFFLRKDAQTKSELQREILPATARNVLTFNNHRGDVSAIRSTSTVARYWGHQGYGSSGMVGMRIFFALDKVPDVSALPIFRRETIESVVFGLVALTSHMIRVCRLV